MVEFLSAEDKLLQKYWEQNPGTLFKEVALSNSEERSRARRLDAIILPTRKKEVYARKDISESELKKFIENSEVEMVEVKKELNRTVIGQILVGGYLLNKYYKPKRITPVIICSKNHSDLEEFCNRNNIKLIVFD